MPSPPNWERWKSKESSTIRKAWTHSILRNLYRDAENEWNVIIMDNREVAKEYEDEPKWQVMLRSSTIDSPSSSKILGFDRLSDAEEFAQEWMDDNPLDSELGWMTLAGNDDREYLEDKMSYYQSKGIQTRVTPSDASKDMFELQVDTEDFINAGMRLG